MEQSKRDVPLFRVHNTVLPAEGSERPLITYYRVNGNAGKLEETFKIAANKDSKFSAGASYENY
jgi:hypothetical protein